MIKERSESITKASFHEFNLFFIHITRSRQEDMEGCNQLVNQGRPVKEGQ